MTQKETSEQKRAQFKSRLILISIFAVGIIPLFIGLFLFYNPHYLSGKTTERGELLSPPLDARPWVGESDKWRIVLLAADECLEECQQMIYFARQAHEALKEVWQRRVTRVILIKDDIELPEAIIEGLAKQSPPITSVYISERELNQLFGTKFDNLAEVTNNIFIVDPHGNLILRYQDVTSIKKAKEMLKDINHLLRASRIG